MTTQNPPPQFSRLFLLKYDARERIQVRIVVTTKNFDSPRSTPYQSWLYNTATRNPNQPRLWSYSMFCRNSQLFPELD